MTDITEDPILAGEHANRILGDPMVQDALKDIRQLVMDQWAATPVQDTDTQHQLRCVLQGMDMFVNYFQTYINEGKIVAAERDRH